MPKITYPKTQRIDVVEGHFGHTIIDPYRWLEKDIRNNEDVAKWVDEQNAVTQDYLKSLPGRASNPLPEAPPKATNHCIK